jgi:hypothetical protein
VHHLVLISLIVFVAATVVGLVVAGLQGLGAWRAFRSFKRSTDVLVAQTTARLAGIELRTAAAAKRAAELDRAREQLQASLASAAVLSDGAREVTAALRLVRGVVPSK